MFLRYGLLAGPWEHGYIKRFGINIRVACIDMNSWRMNTHSWRCNANRRGSKTIPDNRLSYSAVYFPVQQSESLTKTALWTLCYCSPSATELAWGFAFNKLNQTDLKDRSVWPSYSGFIGVYCDVYVLRGSGKRAHSNRFMPFRSSSPTAPFNRHGSLSTVLLRTFRRNLFVSIVYPEEGYDNAKRR